MIIRGVLQRCRAMMKGVAQSLIAIGPRFLRQVCIQKLNTIDPSDRDVMS